MSRLFDVNIDKIHIIVQKNENDDFNFVCPKRQWDGFVLFTKGSGVYKNRLGDEHAFSCGTLLLLNKDDSYEMHSDGPCSYITSAIDLSVFFETDIFLPTHIRCNEKQEKLIKEMCSTWQLQTMEAYTLCKINLLKLYLELYKNQIEKESEPDEDIRVVKEYIHQNYGKNFDFSEITKLLSLSPSFLRAKFKSKTGTTICGYRDNLRISSAYEMLKSKNFTLREIASILGYCDEYHFSKAFKKATGMSPGYIKQNND